MLANPTLVGTARHVVYPGLVVEIPLDSFLDARFEGFGWFPAKFSLNLAGVDGVASVMTGAILDVGNLGFVGLLVGAWAKLIKNGAQCVDNVEVGLFVPATNVIGFTKLAGFEDAADCAAMVLDVEPVADLLSVTIDRQRLARQGVVNDERDELFREVVRAVVVGAVGG